MAVFTQLKNSRVAVFNNKKQEGGSFFTSKGSRVAVFHDKKQEGGSFS